MKASETHLTKLLDGTRQFVIPIYQRPYSWSEAQCKQLFEDVLRVARDPSLGAHFIGSVVYVHDDLYEVTSIPELLVIDGQQRLTTFSLMVEALARRAAAAPEGSTKITAKKLRNYYLFNANEEGDDRFKLVLSSRDDRTFRALIQGKDAPKNASARVLENLEYFIGRMEACDLSVDELHAGLSRLMVVSVALDRKQDNPQLIFESLNSTGLDLSQSDLVRNYVLMGLEPAEQKELYEDHWLPMEQLLSGGEEDDEFDNFLRSWLALHTYERHKVDQGYEVFKRYRQERADWSIRELMADLHRFANHYACIQLGEESEDELEPFWNGLKALRIEIAMPFLMFVRDEFESGRMPIEDAAEIADLVETWLVRRMVCDVPTNALTKLFPTLRRVLEGENLLERFRAWLMLRAGRQRFPTDDEFSQAFRMRNFYEFSGRQYCLTRMENEGRKEPVEMGQYTIEHVMPQNEDLSSEWREMLGGDWERIHHELLHTIGNLTLTGYNPELSDHPFLQKRDMRGGFSTSPLMLNRTLGQSNTWDEKGIKERGAELAARAVRIWPSPEPLAEFTDEYTEKLKERKRNRRRWHFQDLSHLEFAPTVRPLYDRFEAGALAAEMQRVIWKNGVDFGYEGQPPGYSLVWVQPRMKWLGIRLLGPRVLFEGVPEHAIERRDRFGVDFTWVRAQSFQDIDDCLALLPKVIGLAATGSAPEDADADGQEDLDALESSLVRKAWGVGPIQDADHFRMYEDTAACFEGLQEIAAGLGFVPTYHRNWVGFGQPGAGKPFPILVYPRRSRLHVGIRAVRAEPEFPSELEYEGARRPGGRQRFYLNSPDELGVLRSFLPKVMV